MSNKANNTETTMYTFEQVQAMMAEHDKQTRVEMEQAQKSKEEEALKMAEQITQENQVKTETTVVTNNTQPYHYGMEQNQVVEQYSQDELNDYNIVVTFLKTERKMRKKGVKLTRPTDEQFANYDKVSDIMKAQKMSKKKKFAIAGGIGGAAIIGGVIAAVAGHGNGQQYNYIPEQVNRPEPDYEGNSDNVEFSEF